MFKHEGVNWVEYRSRFQLKTEDEVDLHLGKRDCETPYWDAMAEITNIVRSSLQEAQRNGRPYVMFIHGWSTSRLGKTTAGSQVRSFMRSKEATQLIDRAKCIQHYTVFVAKIRTAPFTADR
jgi:hypothetical protein